MKKLYELTKHEIGTAIIHYISLTENIPPASITGTLEKIDLPEKVTFFLENVPKGSRIMDYPHNI